MQNLPDINAILNGEEVPVPESIDLQYALASSLVGHSVRSVAATDKNTTIGNILDFAARFPQREMGVMMVSDIHRAIGEPLFEVPQFQHWANQVADVMLYDAD